MMTVVRPVVRSFRSTYMKEARAWVKAGGHAVVWESDKRAMLVFPVPKKGDEEDLGMWSVLDLGKQRWDTPTSGPYAGLACSLFPRATLWIAKRRAERDSKWRNPTRRIKLDCLTCAACCRDNEVILEKKDVTRFREAKRMDLVRRPLAAWRDGKFVLTLLANGSCRHLKSDNACAIYEIRPDACSQFPAGSECCLFAREEELNVYDGVIETVYVAS